MSILRALKPLDLEVLAGDTFCLPTGLTQEDGTPFDLSGATILFSLKTDGDDLTQDSAGVTIDTDGTAGMVTVTITYEVMGSSFTSGKTYGYRLWYVFSGVQTTFLYGRLLAKDPMAETDP